MQKGDCTLKKSSPWPSFRVYNGRLNVKLVLSSIPIIKKYTSLWDTCAQPLRVAKSQPKSAYSLSFVGLHPVGCYCCLFVYVGVCDSGSFFIVSQFVWQFLFVYSFKDSFLSIIQGGICHLQVLTSIYVSDFICPLFEMNLYEVLLSTSFSYMASCFHLF